MAGSTAGGMSQRLDFTLAGSEDEAELRALLRSQSLPGWVNLSFEREPNYFAAAASEGEWHRVLLARERKSRALVGFCSRSIRRVFFNGEVQRLGYLGQFRSAPDWQGSYRTYRALSKGFAEVWRQLRGNDEIPFDITSILADNRQARRILEADLPGMPHYQWLSGFNTLVYRSGGGGSNRGNQVESGSVVGLAAIADCLQRNYQRYQFSPVWSETALLSAGLSANDFLVLRNGRMITACVAIWDQREFKQAVVHSYKKPLGSLRPLVNLAAPLLGLPRLPPVGERISQAWLSHLACDEDSSASFEALLSGAIVRSRQLGMEQLMLGLTDAHPLLPVAQHVRRHLEYRSDIFLIQWDKSTMHGERIDALPLHLEVATL